MSDNKTAPVLVLGASGTQGGAVARALMASGIAVRAFTRSAATAATFRASGMQAAIGDFADAASLTAACAGTRALFSMQSAPFADPQSERREARAIAAATRAADVPQIVHSSVSGAGAFHRAMKDWGTGRWNENYWDSKADAEDAVRDSGVKYWTILKPAFMMENFLPPKVPRFFRHLANGELVTAFTPKTVMSLVTAEDIGAAAAAAITDPERFNHLEIELAGDNLTMDALAAVLSAAWKRPITTRYLSTEAAVAAGISPFWVNSQLWTNEVGYPATPEDSRRLGLAPTSLADWATKHMG